MRKVLALALALALVLVFAAPVSADDTKPLLADGGLWIAGNVSITDDGETIEVTYNITEEGWVLTETHVDVAINPADLEQNKNNNPRVGKFEWNSCKEDVLSPAIVAVPDGAAPETNVYIAIHGVILNDNGTPEDTTDDTYESIWASGPYFGGYSWAMYVEYTLNV